MAVDLVTRVAVAVRIIDADNPRKKDRVLLSRSGDGLLVTVGVYDPDLDVSRARHEFLDGRGALIGDAIDIDMVDAIRTSGMAMGQSFKLERRFAGQSVGRAVSVRVTLFDPGSSVKETSRP